MKKILLILLACGLLNACSAGGIFELGGGRYRNSKTKMTARENGAYKIGKPYQIFGKWYYPKEDYDYKETGVASWYGKDFHAKYTANGEVYDMNTMTAAHRTLPLPSIVKVTNLNNGKTAILRVNDRGPFAKNRIIDISKKGAETLGFQLQGTTKVKVELMEEESKALKMALLGGSPEPKVVQQKIVKAGPSQSIKIAEPKPKTGKYFVQLGAFNSEDSANNLKKQLQKFGAINVIPTDIGGGKFYRVRLGPYDAKDEADLALQEVKDFGVFNAKTLQD